jgi:hypothetical protein
MNTLKNMVLIGVHVYFGQNEMITKRFYGSGYSSGTTGKP